MPYDDNITQSERKTQEQVLKLISEEVGRLQIYRQLEGRGEYQSAGRDTDGFSYQEKLPGV